MQPFLGQLALFAFGYAPRGWALCAGQLLPINQNQALFSVLGTTYGGDGRTTFALPDLRGRAPVGQNGTNIVLGQQAGEESHVLSMQEVPAHTHQVQASTAAASAQKPNANDLAQASINCYAQNPSLNTTLAAGTVASAGGSLPHENRTPFLAMNWCIALTGVFPSRN